MVLYDRTVVVRFCHSTLIIGVYLESEHKFKETTSPLKSSKS